MSGLTPLHLSLLRDLLGLRGSSMEKLADDVGASRHHLSQIVNGHLKGGGYWARIRACVTAAEWACLLDVEHCATWNKAQREREAAENAKGNKPWLWLMRRQCAACKRWEGFQPCVEAMTEKVSHGICPDCFKRLYADFPLSPGRLHPSGGDGGGSSAGEMSTRKGAVPSASSGMGEPITQGEPGPHSAPAELTVAGDFR